MQLLVHEHLPRARSSAGQLDYYPLAVSPRPCYTGAAKASEDKEGQPCP